MKELIGRTAQAAELQRLYHSGRAEFVAVYGRRRVGKTYLINHALEGHFTFRHTGVSPMEQTGPQTTLRTQLESFYYSLLSHGLEGATPPKTWLEAFFLLRQLLTQLDTGQRQLIFIDELPWMDTPKSGFLQAFENFWNGWCSSRDNVMLVVCGSATSWILSNLSRNRGGLYGRLTAEIKLSPFTLRECEAFFESRNIAFSRYDVIQAYMVMGGIPYYLGYFDKELSLTQNVDRLLFGPRPRLHDEFNRLFSAIFSNPDDCKKIVRLLATRHSGFTRAEIAEGTGLPCGGGLSATLAALTESDFVERYHPYGGSRGEIRYKLIDNFCLFWIKYVTPSGRDATFMTDHATADTLKAWRGVAFEEVCWQHLDAIKQSLGIGAVKTEVATWRQAGDDTAPGAQIDLLISRADNVVNLCEMKFAATPYTIDNDEAQHLQHRLASLKALLPARRTVHLTMITTYGLAEGKHSGLVQQSLTADALFMA